MRKILKLLMVVLIVLGITLSVLNFISIDNMANPIPFPGAEVIGTEGPGGSWDCTGRPFDC